MKKGVFGIVLILFAGFFGCTKKNHLPTTPTITASTNVIESGGSVNLTALSTDLDGDPLTYGWSATGGSFNTTTGTSVIWTAPSVSDTQQYSITVEVSDDKGASASNDTNVTVTPLVTGVTVTQSDLTNDGTIDIKLDNGIMWVQVNGDSPTRGIKAYIDEGGISEYSNMLRFGVYADGMVDQSVYWKTKSSSISLISNSSSSATYRVTTVDTANGKEMTVVNDVTLQQGKGYASITYQITNTGTQSFLYDETTSHIHDGAVMATIAPLDSVDAEAYINGVGIINIQSLTWWNSYTPDQNSPFVVMFKPSTSDSNAITFGFKSTMAYPIHQVVAYYTGASNGIEADLDLMASEFTLQPNATVSWNAIISFHKGGYNKGIQIYNSAK